jgi:hypothetical protein
MYTIITKLKRRKDLTDKVGRVPFYLSLQVKQNNPDIYFIAKPFPTTLYKDSGGGKEGCTKRRSFRTTPPVPLVCTHNVSTATIQRMNSQEKEMMSCQDKCRIIKF